MTTKNKTVDDGEGVKSAVDTKDELSTSATETTNSTSDVKDQSMTKKEKTDDGMKSTMETTKGPPKVLASDDLANGY